jgi:hypothetical protein
MQPSEIKIGMYVPKLLRLKEAQAHDEIASMNLYMIKKGNVNKN